MMLVIDAGSTKSASVGVFAIALEPMCLRLESIAIPSRGSLSYSAYPISCKALDVAKA